MTQPTTLRPENRRRASQAGQPWADTAPLCFRSEAFAEDLCPADEAAVPASFKPARAHAQWRGQGSAPLLGLAMAAVWSVLGR